MQLTKWNVWHSYSSWIVGRIPAIDKWAEAVVRSRMAPLAIHRDGRCWYKTKAQLQTASTEIGFVPNKAEGSYIIPHDVPDYAKECLVQAVAMRTHEQYALADPLGHVPEYIRVYFEPSMLEYDCFAVRVYPQAKIYQDGILLLGFRLLSSEAPYELGPFIDEQVNLFAHQAVATELPAEVVVRAALHGFCYGKRRLWRSDARLRRSLRGKLRPLMQRDQEGDFKSRRVRAEGSVWEALVSLDLAPYNLRALANLHVWALLDAAAGTEGGRLSVVRWPGRRKLGSYWSGRPSIYIAETNPQVTSSKDLVRDHASFVASILMRSTDPFTRGPEELIGPNLREFEDYALFANRGVTLWFGLNKDLFPAGSRGAIDMDHEANLGGFVYDKHVLMEFIEYWYIAHKAVEERSLELAKARKLSELALMERELAALDRSVEEIPPAGEIADLIKHVGICLNVEGVSNQVRANLRFKEVLMQEARDTRNLVFGTVLAVLIGLTGAPALADALVKPLGVKLGWSAPGELESLGLASALLISLVSLAAVPIYCYRGKR